MRIETFLIAHRTAFASLIGKACHALPDPLHRLFEDVAKKFRVAGTRIDVTCGGNMHPAPGSKAAEALVGIRNREYPGSPGARDIASQTSVIFLSKRNILAIGPATSRHNLKERQLVPTHAAGQVMELLQMMHVLTPQYDV